MAATFVRSWIAQDPAGHELHPAAAQVVLLPGLPAVPMGETVDRTVSQARFLLVLHAPAHMVPGGQVGLLGALQQHVLAMWPDPAPPLPPSLTVLAMCLRTGTDFNGLMGLPPAPAHTMGVCFVGLSKKPVFQRAVAAHVGGAFPMARRMTVDQRFGVGAFLKVFGIGPGGQGSHHHSQALEQAWVRYVHASTILCSNLEYETSQPAASQNLGQDPGGPEAEVDDAEHHGEYDTYLVDAEKQVYTVHPRAAASFDAWVAPGENFLRKKAPEWWMGTRNKFRAQYKAEWIDARQVKGVTKPDIVDHSIVATCPFWAVFEELYLTDPIPGRLVCLVVDHAETGVDIFLRQLGMEEHAATHMLPYKPCLQFAAGVRHADVTKALVRSSVDGHAAQILALDFASGQMAQAHRDDIAALASLTQVHRSHSALAAPARTAALTQHVLLICRAPSESFFAQLPPLEIWLCKTGPRGDQGTCVWHFPSLPPSVQPQRGRCGTVRHPPVPAPPWFVAWRHMQLPGVSTVASLAAAAPGGVMAELMQLSPAARQLLDDALMRERAAGYDIADQERDFLWARSRPC